MSTSMDARHSHIKAESEWQQALELEKRLKAIYRKKSFYDPDARILRNQLRTLYESLLFLDAQFAAANDVEVLLWKSVFYRPIEEFRARIKQADKAGAAGAAQLPKVAAAFLRFLEDASLFYQRLVMQLQAVYGDVGVKLEVPAAAAATGGRLVVGSCTGAANENGAMLYSTGSSMHRNMSASIHRCLIYLGDLARYTAQAQPKADPPQAAAAAAAGPGKRPAVEREWQRARDYYRYAAKVLPRSGNPHNQLAVMAVMEGNALKAVYHYARSLCVGIPFLTAKENLLLLFEQNRGAYAELVARKQQQQQQLPIVLLHSELAICYVRLSGLLFDRINQHEYQAVSSNSAAALSAFLSHPALLEFLQRQGRADWQSRADTTPLHLLVLSIFAVQHSSSSSERRGSGSEAAAAAAGGGGRSFGDATQRSLQRGRALVMVFRTAQLLCQAATAALSAAAAAPPPANGALTNAAATAAAAAKPGLGCLLMAVHVLLQWLAAHPEYAILPAGGHVTEELVLSRATVWAAAAQLVSAVAAAYPLQPAGIAAAAGSVVTASGSAGGECEGGGLPEEVELLGFEPLRSQRHPHVTDVGKHAVDEPATRATRILAAARIVAAALAAEQQQQRFKFVGTAGSDAVQPQTLTQLSAAVQQFVAAVAATGTRQGAPAAASVPQQQQQQRGQSENDSAALLTRAGHAANGETAMDVDHLQQQQQQQAMAVDLTTAMGTAGRQQQQQQEDDELEEEVIVFKPRAARPSASTSEDTSAVAAAAAGGSTAAAAAAAAATVASSAPPPLPQHLLASRSHGRHLGVSSTAAAAAAHSSQQQQQQVPDTVQPMITSPAGSMKAAAVETDATLRGSVDGTTPRSGTGGTSSPIPAGTVMAGPGVTPARVGPEVMPVGCAGTGGGFAAGMLLQGHAATALDLQQAQAASDILLARLGGSGGSARHASPPVGASIAAVGGFGSSGGTVSGLPPAPGFSTLGAGMQPAAGFSRGGSGFAGQVNPNISGGGFRSQPPSPAVFAAVAAAAAGAGGFAGGALQQQQQQQGLLDAGNGGLLGLNAAAGLQTAATRGFPSQQAPHAPSEPVNLDLGFNNVGLGLSQQGGGTLDGFEGFDPLGFGLTSALSPGNGGGGLTDPLLGLLGNSAAAGATVTGTVLQAVSNSVPSAPIRLPQAHVLQTQALHTGQLGSSAHVVYQLEQTARAAADNILSPEHSGMGLKLLLQQQQGLGGFLPSEGGVVAQATGLSGNGNLAPTLQQQQLQPTLGRISAPSVLMQHVDPTNSPLAAAAGGGGGGGGLGAVRALQDSADYAMFSGPNVFGDAVAGSSALLLQQQQQRRISSSSISGSHSSHQGIPPADALAALPGVKCVQPGLAAAAAAAAAGDGLGAAGGESPTSPEGGLTLLDYLAKQQQQQLSAAVQDYSALHQGVGGCGVQQEMGLGSDAGVVDGALAGGGVAGRLFFGGGRPGVLLPPVDMTQSQNPFAS